MAISQRQTIADNVEVVDCVIDRETMSSGDELSFGVTFRNNNSVSVEVDAILRDQAGNDYLSASAIVSPGEEVATGSPNTLSYEDIKAAYGTGDKELEVVIISATAV